MIFSTVIKALLTFTMAAMLSPDAIAQYRQYAPSYYYYYQNGQAYAYPSSYQYPRQPAPAAAPATAQPGKKASAGKPERKSSTKTTAKAEDISGWMSNWNAAWDKACKLGRPLVTIFEHEGCPECDKLEATLARADAKQTLENAVKVKLEFSDNGELVHKYGVKFTPTFIVFSPAHNGEVYREVGALSLDRLQTLKPSIDSLVTKPRAAEKAEAKTEREPDTIPDDDGTSRSVAGL